ncbi:MAG: ankyrin repeat domain-containing protein [Ignavibacterium sp.]
MVFDFIETNDIEGLKKALSTTHPKLVDQFGYSALHIALSKGFDEIAEILIEAGIDLNLKDPKGQTALHYCAFYNKPEIARLILQQGGRLDIQDNYGNQPLWTAVFNDYGRGERIEIVEIFINSGAQKEHKNNANRSPKDLVMSRPCENLFSLFGIES